MRRAVLLVSALALPFSGVTTVALAGEAGATVNITCAELHGDPNGGVFLAGCTGGLTGPASTTFAYPAFLSNGGTLNWITSKSTNVDGPRTTSISAKKCVGYVKNGGTVAYKLSATVTADTGTGIKVPGKLTGKICVNSSAGTISALGPIKIN